MRTVALAFSLAIAVACVSHTGELRGSPTAERTTKCDDAEEAALRRRWRVVGVAGPHTTKVKLRLRGDGSVDGAIVTSSSGFGVNDAYALCLAMRTSLPPTQDGQPTTKQVPFILDLDDAGSIAPTG